jgi:peroxiredoxin
MAGLSISPLLAQSADGTGPGVGETIPDFTAVDQGGKPRTFADLTGPNGLLLLFHRSADW